MDGTNYNYGVSVGGVGNVIDVSNPDDTGAQGWRYDAENHTIVIFAPADYTLTGATSENKVLVEPERFTKTSFNLILMGVRIDKKNESNSSAIAIRGGAFCRLLLYQESAAYGGQYAAAVNVNYDSSLELDTLVPDRRCILNVYPGEYAAGIGANHGEAYGNITVKDGELRIIGEYWSYGSRNGIGYGISQSSSQGSGKIKFIGGITTINGGYLFDGIACTNLEISGGMLSIDSRYGNNGSGIAMYGRTGEECKIKISGNAEVTAYGGWDFPGIDCFVSNGKGSLIIDGGMVTATGGYGAAGIGTGHYQGWCDSEIMINGGVITATGGPGGAGIGSGLENQTGLQLQMNGGIICAHGSYGAAGIGAGNGGKVKSIFISSRAKVIAESHNASAYDIGGMSTGSVNYTGLYSGIYSGRLSGLYQGRLSGLFKGKLGREYTNKVSCKLRGFYTGKASGTYSGMFSGRFSGKISPTMYSGLFSGRKGKKYVSKH